MNKSVIIVAIIVVVVAIILFIYLFLLSTFSLTLLVGFLRTGSRTWLEAIVATSTFDTRVLHRFK